MSDTKTLDDPFQILREATGQVVENWSAAMEQLVSTEEFAAASGNFLRQYVELHEAGRTASQAAADSLHIPTKDDLARVAELVVNVERKVDEVSDETHELRGRLDKLATEGIAGVTKRLAAIEATLEKLAATPVAATKTTPSPAKKAPATKRAKPSSTTS